MPAELFTQQALLISGYDYRKADMWSLGVILFEMIYGCKPFKLPKCPQTQNLKAHLTTEEFTSVFKQDYLPKDTPDILIHPFNPILLKEALNLIHALFKNQDERPNINFVLGHPFISDLVKKYEKKNIQSEAKQGFNDLLMKYVDKFGVKVKTVTEKKMKESSTTPARTLAKE